MKEVIRIGQNGKAEEKPVEWTHFLSIAEGWIETQRQPKDNKLNEQIVYLGKCHSNGDMFIDKDSWGNICIFKGHLNSGKY